MARSPTRIRRVRLFQNVRAAHVTSPFLTASSPSTSPAPAPRRPHDKMSRAESGFDWVTARHQCSTANEFAHLRLAAKANVDTRNSEALRATRGEKSPRFQFAENGSRFSVTRDDHEVVDFELRGETIEISGPGVPGFLMKITTTIDHAGRCVLSSDGGQTLERWHVLRHALNPLFFHDPRAGAA